LALKYLEKGLSKLQTVFTFEILVLRSSKLDLILIGFVKLFSILAELLYLYFWWCTCYPGSPLCLLHGWELYLLLPTCIFCKVLGGSILGITCTREGGTFVRGRLRTWSYPGGFLRPIARRGREGFGSVRAVARTRDVGLCVRMSCRLDSSGVVRCGVVSSSGAPCGATFPFAKVCLFLVIPIYEVQRVSPQYP
jgi:hypothetical protein